MKVSVLGLGIIGTVWARNLIDDGHSVRCWNRTIVDFPNFEPSLRDAAAHAEAILVVVSDAPAVQSVLDQILPELGHGQLVILCSTISARWTQTFAEQVSGTRASYLEAPFTGSKIAAERRQTVFYLGGEAEIVEAARPLLQPLSSAIMHIGPLGSASSLKLAMNLNIAGVAQSLCESLTLSRKAGISDDVYFAALGRNVAHSGLAHLKESKLREHDYSPQFSLKHMAKDLRLALETAREYGLSLEQTAHLNTLYDRGLAAGWSDDDFIGLVRLGEQSRHLP